MALNLLGLQAAVTDGTELTFDGQKMQAGTHLRWAFAPELGFPPGAFWLLRRVAGDGEGRIPPPRGTEPPDTGGNGNTGHGCKKCPVCGGECCCCCKCGPSQDRCGAGGPPPPGGPGWGSEGGGDTKGSWGKPDPDGWELWSQPFTLPVTYATWPARYAGALDPATNPDPVVKQRDILECVQRLTSLALLNGMSNAEQRAHFSTLRDECVRLVKGWPAQLNFAVPMQESSDGANAPSLGLHLIEQLQLSSLNPYMARVLGLYFVDTETVPGTIYDYCIVGVWLGTPAAPRVFFPGGAPRGGLGRGQGKIGGLTITADNSVSHFYAWQRDDMNGNYAPLTDPSASPQVAAAFAGAIGGTTPSAQPAAMLAAQANVELFPFPPQPASRLICDLAFASAAGSISVAIAGAGSVTALHAGAVITSQNFASTALQTVTLTAADPVNAPIDEIQIFGAGGFGSVIVVGAVTQTLVPGPYIGTRYALVHGPQKITSPVQPNTPVSVYRKREAIVVAGPKIVVRSSMDVQWVATPASSADQTGNPTSNPIALPPPTRAVGFIAEQADANLASPVRLPQMILSAPQPTPQGSPLLPAPFCLRFAVSNLSDPVKGYTFRVAGFNVFGELGAWSGWSVARGVEHIAGAPTTLRLVNFDNSASSGGHPDNAANPTAWVGGRLTAQVQWSGSALLMYPDSKTARLTAISADGSTTLAHTDFTLPAPVLTTYIVKDIVPDAKRGTVYVTTTPALPRIDSPSPAASLTLTGALVDGTIVSERYAVRPDVCDPTADVQVPGIVATLAAGPAARIVANRGLFIGRPAYLVQGISIPLTLDVPLSVPIADTTARAQASVVASRASPFDPNELIVDPNGLILTHAEPSSAPIWFVGAQYLQPPAPPPPVHSVHHVYYDPADYYGNATRTLGFDTSAGEPALKGYVLERAPAHSLFLADVKRRRSAGLLDNNPNVAGRPDLVAWIAALPAWLVAYNARMGKALTTATLFDDADAVRSFITHFYGGLLDDELRALADVAANIIGFARTNPTLLAPKSTVTDTVNGAGFGRNLYKLSSANDAGSISVRTGSIGPIYTRIVKPSRPPVLYKVQPAAGAFVVAWALDESPDIAGYLVYRATDPADLVDLRFFGADPTHPSAPSTLAQTQFSYTVWHGLSFGAGTIDPRLIGLVNDPRAFARDYDNSDMAEIPLPAGPPPDQVLGIYRLTDFNPTTPQAQPGAFNYWTPPTTGGIAQLKVDSATQSRLTGLRVGLGQGAGVVVVAQWGNKVRTIGSVAVRRMAFIDGAIAGTAKPADPGALPNWTPPDPSKPAIYAVVAVDIWGNRSNPSTPFQTQVPVAA